MQTKNFPFYLLFFSLFPTLSLMGVNIGEATIDNVVRPVVISLLFTLFIFLITLIVVRNINLAGVIALILLIDFFSYGHVFTFLDNFRPLGVRFSRNSILLPTYMILTIFVISWVIRKQNKVISIIPYLNLFTFFLLLFPAFQIIKFAGEDLDDRFNQTMMVTEQKHETLPESITKPDIYLIVLDGYNREDILLKDLDYDNSKFINALRSMGFMVVDCSMGNYTQTRLAMASELNLNYMDLYFPGKELISINPTTNFYFSDNVVRRLLEKSGYQTYAYENTHWPFLNWENVDHLLFSTKKNLWVSGVTEFEKLFFESTLLLIPFQYSPDWMDELLGTISDVIVEESENNRMPYLYNQTYFMLDSLPKLSSELNPIFVYAHFSVTHTPFYFNADGSLTDQKYRAKNPDYATFKEGYSNQMDFINPRLLTMIENILESSSTPPIIILQSDHGYDQTPEKTTFRPNQNLIAIYLPGVHDPPYKTMSSVNIFRYVFKQYYKLDFPYLEDISYKVNAKEYTMTRIYDLEPGCK